MIHNFSSEIIPFSQIDFQEWNNFLLGSSESSYFCTTDHWENFEEVSTLQIRNSENKLIAGIPFRIVAVIPIIGNLFKFCRIDSSVIVNQSFNLDEIGNIKRSAFHTLIGYLKGRNSIFIYMSPMTRSHDAILLEELGFGVDNCATLKLDLTMEMDAIFKSFSKGNKSSIRAAQKKGVEVKIYEGSSALAYLPIFHDQQKKLFEYKKESYSKVYFKTESYLESVFSSEFSGTHFAVAYFDDKPAATAILISYNRVIYYYLGASDYQLIRESKAANLLQFEIIRYAKQREYDIYDFGGIPFNSDPSLETHGVYMFKKSFGGVRFEYDNGNYILNKFWYRIIWNLQRNQHHPLVSFVYNLLRRNSKA